MKKGFPIFMSDDGGSRTIANYVNSSKHKLSVMRLAETLMNCHENGTRLKWKDIKIIVNKGISRETDKSKLVEAYKN